MTPPDVPPALPPPPQVIQMQPYVTPQTSGAAVASLICGTLGLFGCCCCPALALSVAAIVCGHIALMNISQNPFLQGRGLAISGLIMGYIAVAVYGLIMLSSLLNPALYKQIQEGMEKAKQEIHQGEKKGLPADAT